MNKEMKKVLTIDPNKIPEGTCIIKKSLLDDNIKFSICKEKGKIKIFPIMFVEKQEQNNNDPNST